MPFRGSVYLYRHRSINGFLQYTTVVKSNKMLNFVSISSNKKEERGKITEKKENGSQREKSFFFFSSVYMEYLSTHLATHFSDNMVLEF